MSNLNCSVHFLTLKQIGYEESNVAVTFYHDRTHFEANQRNLYAQYAEEFSLQQGRQFVLHNRIATTPSKMTKLKDQVKEFDALFQSQTNETSLTNTQNINNVKNSITEPNPRLSKASQEMNNYFLASQNSKIAKQIWLTQTNLLLIMQDALLVWLIIDPVSGDIIKLLIDKSLTTNNSFKLSGSLICDSALLTKTKQAMLILAYADRSTVDLISLTKSSQFLESLELGKEKLEKFNSFEPYLKKFDFACPTLYRIEKRLSILDQVDNSTFVLWWSNDGQLVWQPRNENQISGISLLERDDLRNNVLVLTTYVIDSNLLEYLFKSDGLLLSINHLNKSSLIAVEQIESNVQKYSICIYRYDLQFDTDLKPAKSSSTLKIKLTSFTISSKIASTEQIKVSKKFILMLSTDQTIITFDLNRNIVNKLKINVSTDLSFSGIEWLLEDLLFVVYDLNGRLLIYDVGFNCLDLDYMTRYSIKFKSLSEYLNKNLFSQLTGTQLSIGKKNHFVKLVSSMKIFKDSLWTCFHFSKGPFGLFRLSVLNDFNCISLVNLYLKNVPLSSDSEKGEEENISLVVKSLQSGVNLLNQLDWDREANLCLACIYKILNFLLSDRVEFSLKIEELIEECLATFYKPKRSLLEKTIYENKQQVSRYARRFFYKLLENDSLGKAFSLAVDIGAKDLFNDLYYCSLDNGEKQLSEVCRKKYHEIVAIENKTKIREEMNRSVTTIDDNIKGVESEFDRYSVSSSENNSNNSIESYCSLEEFKSMSEQIDLQHLKDNRVNNQMKIYTEEEIENYAKQLFVDNRFVHQINMENFH